MAESPSSPSNKNTADDQTDAEVTGYYWWVKAIGLITLSLGLGLTCASLYLAYHGNLSVFPAKEGVPTITSFSQKLEYTARYWIFGLIWLYFMIHVVMMKRVASRAVNPLAGYEDAVAPSKNVLNNSFEQFIFSVASQVTLISFLESEKVVTIIPVMNVLFLIGRITFWLGYPRFRTFGITVTMFPSSLALFFSVYRFFYAFANLKEVIVLRG